MSAKRLAARAAGAVSRPDLQIVGELADLAQRREELARALLLRAGLARRALEQIRTPDVAHEHEVAGENRHRLLGGREILHEKGEMLRSVARRVPRGDADAADVEHVAVSQQLCSVGGGKLVAPLRRSLVGEQQLRAGTRYQLARS